MTVLLVDASVWLAAMDEDDRHHVAAAELVALGPTERDLASLDLTLFEVANVALRRWRSLERALQLVHDVEIASGDYLERVDGEPSARKPSRGRSA